MMGRQIILNQKFCIFLVKYNEIKKDAIKGQIKATKKTIKPI